MDNKGLIGFKGFNYDFTCNGFLYKIKEKIKYFGIPKLCVYGFHFCKIPLDVFRFYPPINRDPDYETDNDKIRNRYGMVEVSGCVIEENEDKKINKTSKMVTDELEIKKELSLKQMIDMTISMLEDEMYEIKKYFNIPKYAIQEIETSTPMHKRNSISKLPKSIAYNENNRSISLTTDIESYSITEGKKSIAVSRSSSICNDESSIAVSSSNSVFQNVITTKVDSISAITGSGNVITLGDRSVGTAVGSLSDILLTSTLMLIEGNNSIAANMNNKTNINSFGENNILISNPSIKTGNIEGNGKRVYNKIISSGKNSILIGMFKNGYFKGEMGSIFIAPIYNDKNINEIDKYIIKKVDGKDLLPNTLYFYYNGEFIQQNFMP